MDKIWILVFVSLLKHAVSQDVYIKSSRLPKTFLPINYELELQPDITKKQFHGKVDIKFKATETEDVQESDLTKIELNYEDLTIDDYEMSLYEEGGQNIPIAAWKGFDDYGIAIVNPSQALKKQTVYKLHLEFTGNLKTTEDNGGLILSSFKNEDGTVSDYVIANFFPVYARRAFPCFDEPYFKATFNLKLSVPAGYKSISNTPQKSTEKVKDPGGEEITWHVYEETPLMAPSSLGILISKLSVYENSTTRINTWAPTPETAESLGQQKWWTFIFQSSIRILTFGSTSHLPKFNYVFIPDLFKPTITSWGIIYIRANVPLYNLKLGNEKLNNLKTLNDLRSNVATGMASQFYGDTVSPVWWDEFWLRDGISEFEGIFFVARYEGEIQFIKFMSGYVRPEVLEQESKQGSIILETLNDDKSEQTVKSMTQQKSKKGAAVLFMLMNAFSQAVFRSGLLDFLKNGDLGTGTTNDLIKLWQRDPDTLPSGITAEKIVNSWLKTDGIPLISVQRRQGTGNQTLIITQQKLVDGDSTQVTTQESNSLDYVWYVPLTYTTKLDKEFEGTKAQFWLSPDERSYTLTLNNAVQQDDWYIFNNKGTGLYRILYDDDNWKLIENQLKENVTIIDELNRAQIVDDIFALAWNGKLSYSVALDVAKYLSAETGYYPWYAAYNAFRKLDIILSQQDVHTDFREYIKPLIEIIYKNIFPGQDIDEFWQIRLRAETLKWACDLEISDCIPRAKIVMEEVLSDKIPSTIYGDYLRSVFCGGLQTADNATWTQVYNLYRKKRDTINEKYLLNALGCIKNEDIIQRYSNLIVTPGELNSEEAQIIFNSLIRRPKNTNVGLTLLTTQAIAIEQMYGEKVLTNLISSLSGYLTTQKQYDQLSSLKSQKINKDSLLAVDQSLNSIKTSITWSETFIPHLVSYFTNKESSTHASPSTGSGSGTGTGGSSDATVPVPTGTSKPSSSSHVIHSVFIILFCLTLLMRM